MAPTIRRFLKRYFALEGTKCIFISHAAQVAVFSRLCAYSHAALFTQQVSKNTNYNSYFCWT